MTTWARRWTMLTAVLTVAGLTLSGCASGGDGMMKKDDDTMKKDDKMMDKK